MADDKAQSASQAGKESAQATEATNKNVEQASKEAADTIKGQTKERFNTTDARLAESDTHFTDVRRNQAESVGEVYDPKTDPEVNPEINTLDYATPSQSQNNLKHPADPAYTDPHMSKNYLGQPI